MNFLNIFKLIPWLAMLFTMYEAAPGPGGTTAPVLEGGQPAPAGAPGATKPGEGTVTPPAPTDDPLALEKPPEKTDPVVEYEPTGDPALDLTLNWLAGIGIGPEDAALVNAQKGDFALLEAKLSLMGPKAKGWETYLALGKKSYEGAQVAAKAKVEATKADIIKVVGSDEEWGKVRAWAATQVTDAERTAVTDTLRGGGLQAKAMAAYLHGLYKQANPAAPRDPVRPDAGRGSPAVNQPMTARAYADAVQALRNKTGRDPQGTPEYDALSAERSRARALGY